jgi:serine/threonine protein kinase
MPAVDDFLKSVIRSGLLNREQLQAVLRGLPDNRRHDPKDLADYLIKTGKLSRFQAGKLLQGTPGGLMLGPFQILAPIGKGGMGTVYLARDQRSEQLLALKILPPKRARTEERLLARFRREMELCQRVAHPHLAWTYEVGVCLGVYYIAMEYIPGKNLFRLVAEEGPLAVARVARLFSEVASALEHAHNQGLIHRDLKPSNIMVTPHDHAKVLDLGLALVQGETAAEREVIGGEGYAVGTTDYMAPEQSANAVKVDPRSDIYALGCTLYYALTGQPPFPGGTSREKIQRHRSEEPASISKLNPAVPPKFVALLGKLMAKDPKKRLASAEAVQEELRGWVAADSIRPLDQPGDLDYRNAVAALEATEPAAELTDEIIPLAELADPAEKIAVGIYVAPTSARPRHAHCPTKGGTSHRHPPTWSPSSWWSAAVLSGVVLLALAALAGLFFLFARS